MPIEIRELVIRATLSSGADPGEPDARRSPDGPHDDRAAAPDVEAIVQECVRQVLRVLARERER